jgi:hypothetical protein
MSRLFIRPNEFNEPARPDYSVIYRETDGRELTVGRIFLGRAGFPAGKPWNWAVQFHQCDGRDEPHDGYAATEQEAKFAWKRCWESADVPINWPPALQQPLNPK